MILENLNILIIDENTSDYLLIKDYLDTTFPKLSLSHSTSFQNAKAQFDSFDLFNVILLDLTLPDVADIDSLVCEVIKESNNTPVIILTKFLDKEFNLKMLFAGVTDYLIKDNLNAVILTKSIQYAIERKNSQQRLEESEKKYKGLFDSSPVPMWVLDRYSLQFLSVNRAAIDLYGYSREEFLEKTVRDLWVPGIEERVEQLVKKNRHDFFNVTVSHFKKNGEIIHINLNSNPIEFDGKNARVTLVNDITARLKAEEALIFNEKKFKALVQEGSDLISILDLDFNYKYCSPTAESILGLSPQTIVGSNFLNHIHSEDLPLIKSEIKELRKKNRISLSSYRIKNAENEWRYIETIMTNLVKDPAIEGIVLNSRDITEFVLQEKKLIESLKRYDVVAKATSDLITDFDIEADEINYSDNFYEIFGYRPSSKFKKGSWWDSKIHPEDFNKVKRQVQEMYANKRKNLTTEYRFQCADGSYKYILDRSYLITNEKGAPKRIIGSMQDITEMKNYIQAIEKQNIRLQEIAWTQSHDIRAPLAKVMGLVDLLKNYKNDLENTEEILENILISAQELDNVIRKIAVQTEKEL